MCTGVEKSDNGLLRGLGWVAHRAEESVGCSALRMMGMDVVYIWALRAAGAAREVS